MKIIKLAFAAIVAGALRQPEEGELTVSNAEATRLHDCGLLEVEPQDAEDETSKEVGSAEKVDDLDDMTVAELGLLVTKEGVPTHGKTKKAELVEAIREHRAVK